MWSCGQLSFKTVAPQKSILEHESFQVQYILQDAKKAGLITPPQFKGFRVVSGPYLYYGTVSTSRGDQLLHNVVYTLEPVRAGVFIIHGASVIVNGKTVRSNDVQVDVITKEEARKESEKEDRTVNSEYFLRPGEDPQKKITENLFVKVMVSKRDCLVGEPVVATFKLYSRLQSKSDIMKNPGMYGFTVFDMINLADREVYAEKINGRTFDVHTIRKVQLYPLQAGTFTIDPMEIKNRVEFSVSAVSKHTEQEIVEGVLSGETSDTYLPGTEMFESSTSTEPVTIRVKPIPEKNKPPIYNGAVGSFSIKSRISKQEFYLNEQGSLRVTISGKGNFTQLDAPIVRWPEGIESFDPRVDDDLDKMNVPLTGERSFDYPFVGVKPGAVRVMPIEFSYYNSSENRYEIIKTDTLDVFVKDKVSPEKIKESQSAISAKTNSPIWLILISVILIAAILLAWKIKERNKKRRSEITMAPQIKGPEPISIIIDDQDPAFYSRLYFSLWKFAGEKFNLSGSSMSKDILESAMKNANLPADLSRAFLKLVRQSEAGMYTTAELDDDKKKLLRHADELIQLIRNLQV